MTEYLAAKYLGVYIIVMCRSMQFVLVSQFEDKAGCNKGRNILFHTIR